MGEDVDQIVFEEANDVKVKQEIKMEIDAKTPIKDITDPTVVNEDSSRKKRKSGNDNDKDEIDNENQKAVKLQRTDSDDNESQDWTHVERQTRSKTRNKIKINQDRFQQMNSSNRNPSLSRERYERNPITSPMT